MKYILIVIGLVSILTIKAETWSEQPKASMHSTSTMPLSGSNLPQAASVGVSTTYDNEAPEPSITTQRSTTSHRCGAMSAPFGGCLRHLSKKKK